MHTIELTSNPLYQCVLSFQQCQTVHQDRGENLDRLFHPVATRVNSPPQGDFPIFLTATTVLRISKDPLFKNFEWFQMTIMSQSDEDLPLFHITDVRFRDMDKANFLCLDAASKVDIRKLYNVEWKSSGNVTTYMAVSDD